MPQNRNLIFISMQLFWKNPLIFHLYLPDIDCFKTFSVTLMTNLSQFTFSPKDRTQICQYLVLPNWMNHRWNWSYCFILIMFRFSQLLVVMEIILIPDLMICHEFVLVILKLYAAKGKSTCSSSAHEEFCELRQVCAEITSGEAWMEQEWRVTEHCCPWHDKQH